MSKDQRGEGLFLQILLGFIVTLVLSKVKYVLTAYYFIEVL